MIVWPRCTNSRSWHWLSASITLLSIFLIRGQTLPSFQLLEGGKKYFDISRFKLSLRSSGLLKILSKMLRDSKNLKATAYSYQSFHAPAMHSNNSRPEFADEMLQEFFNFFIVGTRNHSLKFHQFIQISRFFVFLSSFSTNEIISSYAEALRLAGVSLTLCHSSNADGVTYDFLTRSMINDEFINSWISLRFYCMRKSLLYTFYRNPDTLSW